MTARNIVVTLCGLLVLAAPACHDPVAPPVENLKPEACFEPQVYDSLRRLDEGILTVSFAADPLCSSDDRTPRHDLEMRYDLENDGVWDTEWAPLGYADNLIPDPLPLETWEARMEVRDGEGRTDETVATLTLPDYVPRGPDVGVGFIREHWRLDAGEGYTLFAVSAVVWGWRLPESQPVLCSIHVDGRLVHTEEVVPGPALDREVLDMGPNTPRAGADILPFLTPGLHEVTVTVDADSRVAEADESNNTGTATVEMLEYAP